MSDTAIFKKPEPFRFSRVKMVELIEQTIEKLTTEQAEYEKAIEAYREGARNLIRQQRDVLQEHITYNWGVSLSVSMDDKQLKYYGLVEPTRPKYNEHKCAQIVAELKSELTMLQLTEGDFIPQKYADKILRLVD